MFDPIIVTGRTPEQINAAIGNAVDRLFVQLFGAPRQSNNVRGSLNVITAPRGEVEEVEFEPIASPLNTLGGFLALPKPESKPEPEAGASTVESFRSAAKQAAVRVREAGSALAEAFGELEDILFDAEDAGVPIVDMEKADAALNRACEDMNSAEYHLNSIESLLADD